MASDQLIEIRTNQGACVGGFEGVEHAVGAHEMLGSFSRSSQLPIDRRQLLLKTEKKRKCLDSNS